VIQVTLVVIQGRWISWFVQNLAVAMEVSGIQVAVASAEPLNKSTARNGNERPKKNKGPKKTNKGPTD